MMIGTRGGTLGRKIEVLDGWYCQNTNCPNRALQPFPNSKMYYWNSRHLKVCDKCKNTPFESNY